MSRTCVEATWEAAGAGESRRRRRRRQVPAQVPAPGLHHDYRQITTSVVLLGVQVTDVRRGYLGGRRRRRRRVPAPAPAPGLHHDYGYLGGRRRRRRPGAKSRTCVEAAWEDAGAGAGESRRRPAPGLDHDYGQITPSVVLLGVQVTDVRRGYLGARRRRRVLAPAPAPGLHHDFGQITTSVVLLGVQVADVRRGYLGGRRCRRRQVRRRRRRRDCIMTMARSQPL